MPEFRIREDKGKIKGSVLSSLYMAAPLSLAIALITFFRAEFIAVNIFESPELIPVLKIMSVVPFGTLPSIFLDTTAGSTILTNLLMFIEVWKKEGVISIPFKRIGRVILTAILPLAFIIGLDNLLFDQTPFWFLFVGCIIYFILYLALFLKILGLGEDEKEVVLQIGEITGFREKVKVIIERLGKI
jgi:hypothetical protein